MLAAVFFVIECYAANDAFGNFITVDLRQAANMGFRDEVEGDQVGGWTDQGPNDMRNFPVGTNIFKGVTFDIIDPQTNDGKSIIVMYGTMRSYFPKKVTVDINAKAKTLYFLQNVAWAPANGVKVADYILNYSDGTKAVIPIICGKDVVNWWAPASTERSVPAWIGENPVGKNVGVNLCYLSNPYPHKEIKDLTIEATGEGVLCIVGITLADREAPIENLRPKVDEYRSDTSTWFEFDLAWDKFPAEDSVLNRFSLMDAPAGKHGFLTVQGDQFVFEDGTPARFWGINLSLEACFPTYEQAEIIAKRLAAYGFNIVRLHHLDASFGQSNIFDPTYDDTQHFNMDNLDRMDYFIACLKEQGIYIYLDQQVSREFKRGDDTGLDWSQVPESTTSISIPKWYVYFEPKLFNLALQYSRDLWTHYNPYTGLRYCDDPVFVMMDIINEAPLYKDRMLLLEHKDFAPSVLKTWDSWLKEKGYEPVPWPQDINDSKLLEFIVDVQANYYKKMSDALREIGVKVPITGSNLSVMMPSSVHDQLAHRVCDYVDSHEYWDHPMNWSMLNNNSMLRSQRTVFQNFSFNAPYDKPYFISEWSAPWPNMFRAEQSLWTTAIASFNEWDGLTLFNYRHTSDENIKHIFSLFDTFNDPCYFGLAPVASSLYLRGEIKPAINTYVVQYDPKDICDPTFTANPYSNVYNRTVEISRIVNYFGENLIEGENIKVVSADDTVIPEGNVLQSDTGQIKRIITPGIMTITTTKTEVVQGFIKAQRIELPSIDVNCQNEFAVIALSSGENEELDKAKRLMLVTVAKAENTDTVFDYNRTKLIDNGKAPILVEPVEATISLKMKGDFRVWALNDLGLREHEVPVQNNSFEVSGSKYKTIWYEIERK